jgi:hypothetical protein
LADRPPSSTAWTSGLAASALVGAVRHHHGRPERAAGGRGRPDPPGPPWNPWPAQPPPTTPAAVANARLMPSPNWPGGVWRAATSPDRWGPPAADRPGRPGQPPGPQRHRQPGWPHRPRSLGSGGLSAAGLRRDRDPSPGHPSTHHPPPRPLPPPQPPPPRRRQRGRWVGARLQTAAARLPPILGGAPSRPLDVGRTTRVVQPAQRSALAVRDGGCVFPGCQRPLAWCEAHHLWHWLDGGPTDLDNLLLLCRAHHRAVHDGGWQLTRGPDGRLTATPPDRPRRRQPTAA